MSKKEKQEVEQVAPVETAQTAQSAPVDSREAIALQIATLKKQQAEQREAMKAQRDAAVAALAEQRRVLKEKRDAEKAELETKKAAAKLEREQERAKKAAEKLVAAQEKAAKRMQKEAERLEREKARLAAMQNRVTNPQVEQNGILHPKKGSKCGDAWDLFDEMSMAIGEPISVGEAIEEGVKRGLVEGNMRSEHYRWKTFHGIVGRIVRKKDEVKQPEQVEATA